jgi:hypothetical protein
MLIFTQTHAAARITYFPELLSLGFGNTAPSAGSKQQWLPTLNTVTRPRESWSIFYFEDLATGVVKEKRKSAAVISS